MRDAVSMVAVLEGCSYTELMNLPMDEFLEVRSNVMRITEERKNAMKRNK